MRRGLVVAVQLLVALGVADGTDAAALKRPDLTVAKLTAPRSVLPGGAADLRVRVRNAGRGRAKASLLQVRLGPRVLRTTGAKVKALRARTARTPKLVARLPRGLRAGTRIRLRVCADGRRKVKEAKERNNCRTSNPVLVASGTAGDLITADLKAKRISPTRAVQLRLQYLTGAPQLPARYRGGLPILDDKGALVTAIGQLRRLPKTTRRRLSPYLAPGPIRDAILAARRRRGARGAATAAAECRTFPARALRGVPAADGKAVVWYEASSPGLGALARRVAGQLEEAWPKLTGTFRTPKSDAGVCYGGPDGRFDVYVEPPGWFSSTLAMVQPLGLFADGSVFDPERFCTDTASTMTVFGNRRRFVVAHELMHAIQFAYRYKACAGTQNTWWDEGGANWAGDFVHPGDDDEHAYQGPSFDAPQDPLWGLEGYARQTFFTFLTRTTGGPARMKAIFAALAAQKIRPAVNAAIPGGNARQFPKYLEHLRNRSPVGAAGFPVRESFREWDRVDRELRPFADTPLSVPAIERMVHMPVAPAGLRYCKPLDRPPTRYGESAGDCVSGRLAPLAGAVQHFSIPGQDVREIRLTNPLNGTPGAHVEGWVRLANGRWEVRDWSRNGTVTLCRDKPADDVRELWLVTANAGVGGDGFATAGKRYDLRLRDQCPPPERYAGTFTGVERNASIPEFRLSFTGGTAAFATGRPGVGGFNAYASVSGRALAALHYDDGDCDWDGSRTVSFAPNAYGSPGALNVYGGMRPEYVIALAVIDDQSLTITASNCDDPDRNGRTSTWPLYAARPLNVPQEGTPRPVGTEDKVLAGAASYAQGQQSWDFTWNFRPSG